MVFAVTRNIVYDVVTAFRNKSDETRSIRHEMKGIIYIMSVNSDYSHESYFTFCVQLWCITWVAQDTMGTKASYIPTAFPTWSAYLCKLIV